jgi:F0F1-type ATP synthase membrane subunit b/b'
MTLFLSALALFVALILLYFFYEPKATKVIDEDTSFNETDIYL